MSQDSSGGHQAPGQFLGYSLQVTELLRQLLLARPGDTVSLEVFEDVGCELKNGTKTAIQTKSALATNPIADRSEQLWKTFANWIQMASTRRLLPSETNYEIRVFSEKQGSLAHSFSEAHTLAEAQDALNNARRQILDPKGAEGDSKKPWVKHAKDVLEGNPSVAAEIVRRFKLSFGSGSSRADLEKELQAKFVPPEAEGVVLDAALGWVKTRCDEAIERGEPAAIPVNDFLKHVSALVGTFQFGLILHDFSRAPSQADVRAQKARPFVSQLTLITVDEEEILEAINTHLRASSNRTQWASLGMVWERSFDAFEDALRAFWKNTKKKQDLDHASEEGDIRGRRLLYECMQHREKLEGKEVTNDFTPGSYHALADELEVGWHPDYKDRLKAG